MQGLACIKEFLSFFQGIHVRLFYLKWMSSNYVCACVCVYMFDIYIYMKGSTNNVNFSKKIFKYIL